MKWIYLSFLLVVLASCAPAVSPCVVDGSCGGNPPDQTFLPGTSYTPAPASNAQDPYQGLYATQTAVGVYRDTLDREQAELQMQLLRDSATSTAAAQMTSTAVAGSLATSAAGTQIANIQSLATSQAAGTQTAFPLTQTSMQATQQVEQIRLQVAKAQAVVWPVLRILVFIAFVALAWLWLRKLILARHLQQSQIRPDETGRYPAVPEDAIPGHSKRLVNPNLMHRAVHDPAIPDDLDTQQALANAHDQRRLETIRSVASSPAMPRLAAALLKEEQNNASPDQSPEDYPMLPRIELPESNLLNQWDGKLLPYGADEYRQLLTVDPSKRPHLMITGMTGAGKSRFEIRTLVAGALASGWQVIVIGKQADYIPFQGHANAVLIPANAIKESDRYVQLLKAASEEMFRRDAMLTAKHISTWDRYGGPQSLIVVDDYSAAMTMMPKTSATEVLNWLLALAMDGRKYGLNLLLGLQRASWTVISTDLRSQMARITMRVASAHESRIILDEAGAEALPDRHFLARLGEDAELIRGAAFAMSDQETHGFLSGRPVHAVGEANWVDAVTMPVEPETMSQPNDTDSKILAIYEDQLKRDRVSLSAIQRAVYGRQIPAEFYHVQELVKQYQENHRSGTTTTTTTTPKTPDPGSVAA